MGDRRSFLKMLAGGTALALAPAVKIIPALAPVKVRLESYSFADMVTETLRKHQAKVADNVMQNNALLKYLKDNDRG